MQKLFPNANPRPNAGQSRRLQAGPVWPKAMNLAIAFLTIIVASPLCAQSLASSSGRTSVGSGATTPGESANLPIEQIGPADLIGLTVYDSPELTRSFRVDSAGTIRLPMLQQHIQAAGLNPEELENAIKAALINGGILVDPVVTVSVVEYRSRPINVVGAVRNPVTFQDTGTVTLLDAISQAGGLTDNAGQEILISREQTNTDGKSTTLIQRVSVHDLYNSADPLSNLPLHGGEVVRVPEAGRFYVVGNVKNPGIFAIDDSGDSSVLKALALTHGLDRFPANIAYIYRTEGGTGGKSEIPIPLNKIMRRQAPDVQLMANDVLYIPEAHGRRATATVIGRLVIIGAAIGTTLLYYSYR